MWKPEFRPKVLYMLRRIETVRRLTNYRKQIDVIWIPNNAPKQFPEIKGQPLTADNVNSGVTAPHVLSLIFRYEEVEKVLLHELIHYIGLERPYVKRGLDPHTYFDYTKSNRDLLIDETITETFVIIWHSMMNALELFVMNGKNIRHRGNTELIYGQFVEFFEMERKFGILQSAKLLRFFDIQDVYQFIDHAISFRHEKCDLADCGWLEKFADIQVITPAIVEYLFLRAALLFEPQMALNAIAQPKKSWNVILSAVANQPFLTAINEVKIPDTTFFIQETLRLSAVTLKYKSVHCRKDENEFDSVIPNAVLYIMFLALLVTFLVTNLAG